MKANFLTVGALVFISCLFGAAAAPAASAAGKRCYPNPKAGPVLFPHDVFVKGISCAAAGRLIGHARPTANGFAVPGYRCGVVRKTSFESKEYRCTRGALSFRFQIGG